jgi:2,4-dienoyl-CoA reductase-like NADH-dependent reductase (Old Yellow Enzyme family)
VSADILFAPLKLGACEVPNRIVRTAHATGTVGDDLIAYHEERARGGVGLTIFSGIAAVHHSSPMPATHNTQDDALLPFYEQISTRLHRHGTKVFQQLWHGGAANAGAGTPWAPSAIPNPLVGIVPRELTVAMIDELVEAFAVSARRCRDGGLDGVELHGAHGYLIGHFLSPATNLRVDGYGGTREGRVRFLVEVLRAIRAEVGDGFPVGVRLSADDQIEAGIDPEEAAAIARLIEPHVDFVDVSLASYWRFHKMLSTLDDPLGYEIPTSEIVTRAVRVPTIVTGRIMTLDHARQLVESGVADLVSMVRAMIADPYLVAKARAGREAEIRPCIGTGVGCVAQVNMGARLECVVNVAAGHEATVPFEAPALPDVGKRVLVVGGGPAGLEAARTAALRGHQVELYEMTGELGGQVRMAVSLPHRADLAAITRWLADELQRLGVAVYRRVTVDPDLVVEAGPDVVIIATGSTPRTDGFQLSAPTIPVPGAELPHVFTSWDVLGRGGRADVGRRAVVFDDTGTFEAIAVADALMGRGAMVTLLSRLEQVGAAIPFPPGTVEASRERLFAGGIEFVPFVALREITSGHVVTRGLGHGRERTFDADTVVLVSFHHPNRELADELVARCLDVRMVGDVNGYGNIRAAIHEAAAVARSI